MSKDTKQTHPILSWDFEDAMNRVTATVIRTGNSAILLPSGVESYRKRWDLLARAERSIHIVAFSMMKDETSKKLRDIICEKSRLGVAARLIFDDAVLYSTFAGPLLKDMVKAGGEVIRYHKVFRDMLPNCSTGHPFKQLARIFKIKLKRRFHEKYMVVDGREAILGGINWGNKYAYGGIRPKAWRDSDVYLSGPIVSDIQNQFIKDFFLYRAMDEEYYKRRNPEFESEQFYQQARESERRFREEHAKDLFPKLKATGDERIRYIPHKPYDEERLPLTNAHLMLLRNAQKFIFWGCHGIRPPRIMAETLVEAVRRGVEVRLITNSRKSSQTLMLFGLLGWMYWESSNHFRYLLQNGIRLFEWQKPGAFHSKNMVIDDVVASIGSYNIARGSTFHHTESNVIIYGGNFPVKVRQQFEIDFKDCREIFLDEVKIPSERTDPYKRLLHWRNFLIDNSLLTEAVRMDLQAGRHKSK
jgi:cardiolipin synthase